MPAGARGKNLVDVVIQASERASELTRQLLAYSRKPQMVLKPLDLHQLIEGVLTLLRGSLSSGIHVQLQLSATHSTLNADAALLQSAIVNLLVNARDAMPKGGNLTISTTAYAVGKLSRTLAAQLATRSRPSGTVHHLPRAIGKT